MCCTEHHDRTVDSQVHWDKLKLVRFFVSRKQVESRKRVRKEEICRATRKSMV
jgi:hypothetical protein